MKKKKSIVIGLAILFVAIISCGQEDQIDSFKPVDHSITVDKNSIVQLEATDLTQDEIEKLSCSKSLAVPLYAGQDNHVGTITISNSEDELFITYSILDDSNWWLMETHLFVGEIDDAPFNNKGNPQIGKFPYHGDHDLTKEYPFGPIPLDDLSENISIIAHAVVVQQEDGQTTANETAFGFSDKEFEGNRWGWIIDYEIQNCDNEDDGTNDDDEDDDGNEENDDDGNQDDEVNDSGTEGNSDTDQDGTNETDALSCVDAYAYHEINPDNASCFSSEGAGWGWSNKVDFDPDYYNIPGLTYIFPLYESNDQCGINTNSKIGQVEITIMAGDSEASATVKYILDIEEWTIEDIQLYVGQEPYPINSDNGQGLVLENFNYSLEDFDASHMIHHIMWPLEGYFIAYAKICPPESSL